MSEQDLVDAIVGAQEFRASELIELDLNADGFVDVADIIFLLNGGGEVELDGYKWLVSASFASNIGGYAGPAHEYIFVLSVADGSATVTTIDEFDPTKGLLNQNISGPGQVPGELRVDYAPTQMVPPGTTFYLATSAEGISLVSDSVSFPASDSRNPSGRNLDRFWEISLSKAAISSGELSHGSITEIVSGFLPGEDLINSGSVRIVRYAPSELLPLDAP